MSGLLILSLLCILGLSLSKVAVLTDDNFDGYLQKNDVVLVEFYAPWCGHCKKLEPEYDAASEQLGPDEGKLAKVDATVEKKVGERFKIQGYPSLKLFRNGNPSDYEGGRTAASIVGYMRKQSGPAVKELKDASQLKAFIPTDEGADPVVVAFAESGSATEVFINTFGPKFRDQFTVGLVTSSAVAADNKMGTIVLFKPFDELQNLYEGELQDDALKAFLVGNSMPAVAEIGPSNYQTYLKRGLPLCWLFLDLGKNDAALGEYKAVAGDFKEKLSLVYLSGTKYSQMVTKLGLSGKKYPAMSIEADELHYVFSEDLDFTAANLKKFFASYVAGDLKPTMKSESIPASLYDENNVATVVGDNFNQVVMDKTKDVLIEFYAPWCGHCKSLVPEWNKLGTAMKDFESVVIAMTDATANDYPKGFKVSGFPSIKFVTAEDNSVVEYNGGRTADDFVAWIEKNAKAPMVKSAPSEPAKDEL